MATGEVMEDIGQRKRAIREESHERRNAQQNKDELSREIVAKFMALPEYAAAATVTPSLRPRCRRTTPANPTIGSAAWT